MKYEISKSKLQNIMTKHLDEYIENTSCGNPVRRYDNFILIPNCDEPEFEIAEPYFEYDYEDGRLYIYKIVLENFQNLFGRSSDESKDFISNWFSNKFKVKVEFTAS